MLPCCKKMKTLNFPIAGKVTVSVAFDGEKGAFTACPSPFECV